MMSSSSSSSAAGAAGVGVGTCVRSPRSFSSSCGARRVPCVLVSGREGGGRASHRGLWHHAEVCQKAVVGSLVSGVLALSWPSSAWAGPAGPYACWGENPSGCKESTLSVNQGDARVSDKIKHTGEDLRKYNFTVGDARNVDFTGSNFQGAYLMKGVFFQTKFDNSDMSNTLDDRSVFTEASFVNANLTNAVFTRSDLTGAVVTGADFSGAILDKPMVGKLCRDPNTKGTNPVTGVDTRASLGCPKKAL